MFFSKIIIYCGKLKKNNYQQLSTIFVDNFVVKFFTLILAKKGRIYRNFVDNVEKSVEKSVFFIFKNELSTFCIQFVYKWE